MITKFDSLYAGHVDMDDIGYGGTAVNSRVFPNEHLVTVFAKARNLARLLDRCGYDTFWLAEHHFQREGYECIPNVLLLALDLAHQTERLKMGCGFNITPMWHPLRLAEDFAAVDVLTGGRVRFGVGRGYHTREVDTFGAPLLDQAANRELFEEQVEIIFKAFNNAAFSHEGKHYTIPARVPYRGYDLKDLTLVPRPVHPVECWQPIQSATPRGLDFMAKHGIKGLIGGGVAEGGAMRGVIGGLPRRVAPGRARDRAGRGALHRVPLPARRDAGSGHQGRRRLLRGEPQDVRAAAPGPVDVRGADRRDGRSEAGAVRRPAHHRGSRQAEAPTSAALPRRSSTRSCAWRRSIRAWSACRSAIPWARRSPLMLEQLEWFAAEVMPAFTRRAR